MKHFVNNSTRQRGVALVTALLFLLVVTVIAVTAANNSNLGLKMSASMQDSYRSFHAAEAGVYAALGLAGGAQDPFTRTDVVAEPFQNVSTHPLRNLAPDPNDPGSAPVDVDVFLISIQRPCPRPPTASGGSSVGVFDCDYYRIQSEHDAPGRARTRVELGVVKTVIGST
ncbi:MAG: pilus assembly PilX N-terminal domain-containing protein [Halieaceae bacterium]|nr:pilus assembly PilX N-terminal domain-containing protein [Halieaceae bacterium]